MIQKRALILVYDQKSFLDHTVEKRMSLEMLCKIFLKAHGVAVAMPDNNSHFSAVMAEGGQAKS